MWRKAGLPDEELSDQTPLSLDGTTKAGDDETRIISSLSADRSTSRRRRRRKWICGATFVLAAVVGSVLIYACVFGATSPAPLPPPCMRSCGRFVHHHKWTAVLAAHVRPSTITDGSSNIVYSGFDYQGLSANDTLFREYVADLASADLTALDLQERKALFINAYNALAVKLLVDALQQTGSLPVSIKDLGTLPIGGLSVWKRSAGAIGGATNFYSLDDIEHGVLRPTYKDPRLHAAVNCASISCPDLPSEGAMEPGNLEEQLNAQTTAWLANPTKGVALPVATTPGSPIATELTVNKIFAWYQNDFDDWSRGIFAFIASHLPPLEDWDSAREWLRNQTHLSTVQFFEYDWRVNDANPRR